MEDGNVFFFLVFAAFSFFSLKIVFHTSPVGSTVALTTSSCISVRLQPLLRACAEPPVGVSPQRRSPLVSIYNVCLNKHSRLTFLKVECSLIEAKPLRYSVSEAVRRTNAERTNCCTLAIIVHTRRDVTALGVWPMAGPTRNIVELKAFRQ